MSVKDRIRRIVFTDKLERNKIYAEQLGICILNSKEQHPEKDAQTRSRFKED